ncbi:hypothetical protein N9E48_05340 [Paracoccaceae bacterium]|nr:hypothetical protein [Paracoccaceae bacterium]
MIPDFALSLSDNGVCLLERVDPEWIILGQINLSDNDFDNQIAKLRNKGLAKSPNADLVKLVIPNEQIKYYSLVRPADTLTAEIEALITQNLVQETPYSISEIAFDWVTSRERIFVAAVTLQTLQEAENFAKQQGFKPLGNVAIPPANEFIGEVFFGLSDGTQAKMKCDQAEIKISPSRAVAPISPEANLGSLEVTSPKAPVIELTFTNVAEPAQTRLETQTDNIVFQSVRNVDLGQLKNQTVGQGKSALTLIAPIDQDIRQALASFKSQNITTAPLFSRLANVLYGNSQTTHSKKNHNRLMNAGFLPAFILILATVCLVSTGIFYLAKPAILRFSEHIAGPPASPDVTIKLTLPLDLSVAEKKFILSDKHDQMPKLSKEFLAPLVIPDTTGESVNPYADLTSTRPSIGIKHELGGQFVFKPDLEPHELQEDYTLDSMVALQPTSDSAKLELPKKYSKFKLIQEKLHRIYALSGIWSFSPKAPNSVGSTYVRGMWPSSNDLSVGRLQESSLAASADFETDLGIVAMAMSPAAGINLNPQQTKITETNFDSSANLESTQIFSAVHPVLSESTPQLRALIGNKTSSGASLRMVLTPIQEITPLTKPKIGNADQQNQRASGINFAALVKPEVETPLRLPPAELAKPKIDNATPSPTGRPIFNIRPLTQPLKSDQTISEKGQASLLRPKSRPPSIKPILPLANETLASVLLRPKKRPTNIKPVKSVAATRAILPEDEGDEASVRNDVRNNTNNSRVSNKATIVNVLDLRSINLIGVYLSSGKRSALIRLTSGKRVIVKVGDNLDGGKVAAIGDTELRYIKRGQNITLELPKG